MTYAEVVPQGIEVTFADGRKGLVPVADVPEIKDQAIPPEIELPSPYQIVLRTSQGEAVELPWDFVRHYCDPAYRSGVEATATGGRQVLGVRIRHVRETAGLTQKALASAAGIGRVTLVRIENGAQSPRYETLIGLARALGRPTTELLIDGSSVWHSAPGKIPTHGHGLTTRPPGS